MFICSVWVIIDEDGVIKVLEFWFVEVIVFVDKFVSIVRDEELVIKVVLVVLLTFRFFLRFFLGNVVDDEVFIGNGDDVWCFIRDDLLFVRENEFDRVTWILLLVGILIIFVWGVIDKGSIIDEWGFWTLVLILNGMWILEDANDFALEVDILLFDCEFEFNVVIWVLVLIWMFIIVIIDEVLLFVIDGEFDEIILRLFLIWVFIIFFLDIFVDGVIIIGLVFVNVWMFEDESIFILEADEFFRVIVLDWIIFLIEELVLLVLVVFELSCVDIVVKFLFWFIVVNEFRNIEGEEMMFVEVGLEDFKIFVNCDVIWFLFEVLEKVIVGVIDEVLVWMIVDKSDLLGDCVVIGLLLLEMISEIELIVLVELLFWDGSDLVIVGINVVDSVEFLDMIEEFLGDDWRFWCLVVVCIIDNEVVVIKVEVIFCIFEILVVVIIGVKLLDKVIVFEVEVLFVRDLFCNFSIEEVIRGMVNVLDSDGVDCILVESTFFWNVLIILFVVVIIVFVIVLDDKIEILFDMRFNVDEGVIMLLFVEIFITSVEDVSVIDELIIWFCVLLVWVVEVMVCVNVIEGNFDCILEVFVMFSVILGVVDVDKVVLWLVVVIGKIVFFII